MPADDQTPPEPPASPDPVAVTDEEPEPVETDAEPGEGKPSWTTADQIALTAIVTIGGALRIARVASPGSIVFDETYYAKDACWNLFADPTVCQIDTEQFQVHPHLAKWIIALGIRIFGYNSLGWRLASVVAGTITIALVYLLARKLLQSTVGASVAAGLLAFDFLHFVQSRIAMLDIFVPLFGVAAFLFVVYDRERLIARAKSPPGTQHPHGLLDRPWRVWAGLAGAAAISSKWTGGLYLLGVLVLTLVWEYRVRRTAGERRPALRVLREEGPSIVVWMMVVPFLFYMFTYIGRIHGTLLALPWSDNSWLGAWWDHQTYMAGFHRGLDAMHSYQSPPWAWLALKRPVSYFFETDPNGNYKEVMALGNPLVWWSSALAVLYATWRWLRRRGIDRPEGVIVMGFFITYGPWLVPFVGLAADRPAVFLFYLLPTIPFMCLALGYIAARISDTRDGKIAVGVFSAATLTLFGFYYPLMANVAIPQPSWDKRIWIFDRCDKPPGIPVTTTITETIDGRTKVRSSQTTSDASLPPTGWCWI